MEGHILANDISRILYTNAMGVKVSPEIFMKVYCGVHRECIAGKEYETYRTLCIVLTNFYSSYKTSAFLPHIIKFDTYCVCQLYAFFKMHLNKDLSRYILQLVFETSDETLCCSAEMVLSAFSFMKRFWLPNNREWTRWGSELICERFSLNAPPVSVPPLLGEALKNKRQRQ